MLRNGESRPAVFLDRDGVINGVVIKDGKPHPPSSLEQLVLLPGLLEAIRLFEQIDLEIVVVTNQPDVARGLTSRNTVKAINRKITELTGLKNIYCCFHDEVDFCVCRKPRPGLLNNAAIELNLDLTNSFLIGDRWKDIQAGQEVGCSCFFIDYGYAERKPEAPFRTVTTALEAASIIATERTHNS